MPSPKERPKGSKIKKEPGKPPLSHSPPFPQSRRYIHILDPRTGAPAESDLLSATVVSPDGTLADALSTAVFVMGLEDAAAYWRAHEGFELVLITNDGAVYVTEGLDSLVQTTARRTTLHRQSNAAPAK